ncbi:MAG: thioredoxin family protein [Chthoniobacterales bacterium]|nr:thioredoxin family protein [Chthoniobacterales bacterium]
MKQNILRSLFFLLLFLSLAKATELTRMFHPDHLREPGSQMDAALISKSSSGSMYSYSRRQTSSLALPHQPSRRPRHDQDEISGLTSSSSLQNPSVVTPHLLSLVDKVQGGDPFEVDLLFEIAPHWHLYWQYPGDAGFPPRIEWKLPEGWSVSKLEFSLPEQFSEPGEMTVYGYEHKAWIRAQITPSRVLDKKKSWSIEASVSWLACSNLCVPGKRMLTLNVPVSLQEQHQAEAAVAPALWPSQGALPIALTILHKSKDYIVSFKAEEGNSYEIFPLPQVGASAGHVINTQQGSDIQIIIPWEDKGPFYGLLVQKDSKGIRQGWFVPAALPNQLSTKKPVAVNFWTLLLALASGLLGGFILNLMPCVLPVISLKIFGFINQAGSSRSNILRHGLAFIAGIYLWFLTLGALIALLKASGMQVTWAFQFQNSGFLLAVSVLVFLFALNLFGVFEITLSQKTGSSLDALASRSGYAGSFFQGLFATLLATPCTAPFLGSALGFAFAQSGVIIMTMFAAIATGMSLPYLLLSAQPGWIKWLPRPGAWMEKIKVLMGFPLLATNLWLLSVIGVIQGMGGMMALLILLFLLGLSAWIYGAYAQSTKKVRCITIFLSLMIVFIASWNLIPTIVNAHKEISKTSSPSEQKSPSSQDEINWVPYSASLLKQFRNEGKPVFVDFTAAWCLTCQFNERSAINTNAVRALLRERHIVAMKADWTSSNAEITQALHAFGRVGVPFYLFYPASAPGQYSEPIIFPELLLESQLINAFSK